jgi:hypothetical protein
MVAVVVEAVAAVVVAAVAAVVVAAVVAAVAAVMEVEAVEAAMVVVTGAAAVAAIAAAVTVAAITAAATMARGIQATPPHPPVAVAPMINRVTTMGYIAPAKSAMTTAFTVQAKLATTTVCMSVASQAMTKGPDNLSSTGP